MQAYEGMLRAIEQGRESSLRGLQAKIAIAELAEAVLGRICRVIGGGTFSRSSPFGYWFEDVREAARQTDPDLRCDRSEEQRRRTSRGGCATHRDSAGRGRRPRARDRRRRLRLRHFRRLGIGHRGCGVGQAGDIACRSGHRFEAAVEQEGGLSPPARARGEPIVTCRARNGLDACRSSARQSMPIFASKRLTRNRRKVRLCAARRAPATSRSSRS
jgi:hypothetical protein